MRAIFSKKRLMGLVLSAFVVLSIFTGCSINDDKINEIDAESGFIVECYQTKEFDDFVEDVTYRYSGTGDVISAMEREVISKRNSEEDYKATMEYLKGRPGIRVSGGSAEDFIVIYQEPVEMRGALRLRDGFKTWKQGQCKVTSGKLTNSVGEEIEIEYFLSE